MCKSCKSPAPFMPSLRRHGKHPVIQFRRCKACGMDVQGTIQPDGSYREFTTSVNKGGTNVLTFRFSDEQVERMRKFRTTARQLAERGLEAFEND